MMNQNSWSVVIGSAIAVLASTQSAAYGAASGTVFWVNQGEETTQISLRIPTEPRQPRNLGSRGGRVYAIAPSPLEGMDVIWRDRPLLIWEGAIAQVEISDAESGELHWSQAVSAEDCHIAYAGEPLQPGRRYEWRLCDRDGSPVSGGVIQFQVLATQEQDRIATALAEQDTALREKSAAADTIALDRANFFANRRLWADVLMETFALDEPQKSLAKAKQFIEDIAHINRWFQVATFTGEDNSPTDVAKVQIQVFSGEGTAATAAQRQDPYQLSYQYNSSDNEWEEPSFRVKLTNKSQAPVFLALFDLTDSYSIETLFEEGTVRLEPGQDLWLNDGDPIYGFVPDELWQRGITTSRDIYQAIACTKDFDPNVLTQEELDDPSRQRSAPRGSRPIKHLLQRAIERKSDMQAKQSLDIEWSSSQIILTFVRTLDVA